ncbi:hypothetical protein NAI73_11035, partial [Francisella tularensis subsp. holarctica]|nr:hypothetical protein [Francisella tularensis subsp. holarctica]
QINFTTCIEKNNYRNFINYLSFTILFSYALNTLILLFVLSLSEVYSKYLDQDTMRIIQDVAVKSAIILFSFLEITSFFQID